MEIDPFTSYIILEFLKAKHNCQYMFMPPPPPPSRSAGIDYPIGYCSPNYDYDPYGINKLKRELENLKDKKNKLEIIKKEYDDIVSKIKSGANPYEELLKEYNNMIQAISTKESEIQIAHDERDPFKSLAQLKELFKLKKEMSPENNEIKPEDSSINNKTPYM